MLAQRPVLTAGRSHNTNECVLSCDAPGLQCGASGCLIIYYLWCNDSEYGRRSIELFMLFQDFVNNLAGHRVYNIVSEMACCASGI
jgi:hypothetical protein